VNFGQDFHFKIDGEPLLNIKLVKSTAFYSEPAFYDGGSVIFVKIGNEIESLFAQPGDEVPEIVIKGPDPVNVGAGGNHGLKLFFRKKMNFGARELQFQATHHGTGEDNVANGTEPDHQYFPGFVHLPFPRMVT
jgi:hypothetical protein